MDIGHHRLNWSNSIRYVGVYLKQIMYVLVHPVMLILLYRPFNAIFGELVVWHQKKLSLIH